MKTKCLRNGHDFIERDGLKVCMNNDCGLTLTPCKRCEGTGKIGPGAMVCPNCAGRGWVLFVIYYRDYWRPYFECVWQNPDRESNGIHFTKWISLNGAKDPMYETLCGQWRISSTEESKKQGFVFGSRQEAEKLGQKFCPICLDIKQYECPGQIIDLDHERFFGAY